MYRNHEILYTMDDIDPALLQEETRRGLFTKWLPKAAGTAVLAVHAASSAGVATVANQTGNITPDIYDDTMSTVESDRSIVFVDHMNSQVSHVGVMHHLDMLTEEDRQAFVEIFSAEVPRSMKILFLEYPAQLDLNPSKDDPRSKPPLFMLEVAQIAADYGWEVATYDANNTGLILSQWGLNTAAIFEVFDSTKPAIIDIALGAIAELIDFARSNEIITPEMYDHFADLQFELQASRRGSFVQVVKFFTGLVTVLHNTGIAGNVVKSMKGEVTSPLREGYAEEQHSPRGFRDLCFAAGTKAIIDMFPEAQVVVVTGAMHRSLGKYYERLTADDDPGSIMNLYNKVLRWTLADKAVRFIQRKDGKWRPTGEYLEIEL